MTTARLNGLLNVDRELLALSIPSSGGFTGAVKLLPPVRFAVTHFNTPLVFWLTVVLNLSPLVYVHTPQGSDLLARVHAAEVSKADCEMRYYHFPVKCFFGVHA